MRQKQPQQDNHPYRSHTPARPNRQPPPQRKGQRRRCQQDQGRDQQPRAARNPSRAHRRGRDQNHRQPAHCSRPHGAHIEQMCIRDRLGFAFLLAISSRMMPGFIRAFMPIALVTQTMPLVALTPLLVLMLGRGLSVTLWITISVTFFPAFVLLVQLSLIHI